MPAEITSALVGHMCAKKMNDPSSIDGMSKSAFCVYGLFSSQYFVSNMILSDKGLISALAKNMKSKMP